MDPQVLVSLLTPFLPILLDLGKETANAIAGKIGDDVWDKSKEEAVAFWNRIHPKAKADTGLIQAAQDVAKAQEALTVLPASANLVPASEDLEDYQRLFARKLKAFLDANPDLQPVAQQTVMQMVRIEGQAGNIRQIAKREGRVDQSVTVAKDGKALDISQEA